MEEVVVSAAFIPATEMATASAVVLMNAADEAARDVTGSWVAMLAMVEGERTFQIQSSRGIFVTIFNILLRELKPHNIAYCEHVAGSATGHGYVGGQAGGSVAE